VPPALGALLVLLWIAPTWSDDRKGGLRPASLQVGFSNVAFLKVNRNDIEASFKALTETLGRRRGYLINSKTELFDDISAFKAALKRGTINLAIIDPWTCLSMDIGGVAAPLFVSMAQGKVGKKYVVLTRRGSGLNTLADLRGKEITEHVAINSTMGRPWLETVLLENRLGTPETFFGRTESVEKPSAAVLPVFFGKKHACLVDEPGLDLMKELNPQVGKELQAVAVSEPFLNGVICLSNAGWASETFKLDLIQTLGELHLEAAGQQILTLFKTDQLIPFQEKHLDTVRQLRAKHDHLLEGVKL
jgi:phosphonate transport system substrate-binding protein